MPDRRRCVAYDLDGTLVDSTPALRRAYEAFMRAMDRAPSDAEFDELIGPSLEAVVSRLKAKHKLPLPLDELMQCYHTCAHEAYRDGAEPVAGAETLLEWTRASGLGCALVTSAPRDLVEGLLTRLAWRDRFDAIVCGDDVARAKPDPAVYRRACELGGWAPAVSAAVEDSPTGVRSAAACGMFVIGVGGTDQHRMLATSGAAQVCTTLDQVHAVLQEWRRNDGLDSTG